MRRLLCISGVSVLLLGLGAGTGMLRSVAGESPPETVTSDTLAYCRQLADRVDQLKSASPHPPQSVNELTIAGKDMCEQGIIRGGILRLRSALVLLLHPQGGGGDSVELGRTE
jgi:hypothetical protein